MLQKLAPFIPFINSQPLSGLAQWRRNTGIYPGSEINKIYNVVNLAYIFAFLQCLKTIRTEPLSSEPKILHTNTGINIEIPVPKSEIPNSTPEITNTVTSAVSNALSYAWQNSSWGGIAFAGAVSAWGLSHGISYLYHKFWSRENVVNNNSTVNPSITGAQTQ